MVLSYSELQKSELATSFRRVLRLATLNRCDVACATRSSNGVSRERGCKGFALVGGNDAVVVHVSASFYAPPRGKN